MKTTDRIRWPEWMAATRTPYNDLLKGPEVVKEALAPGESGIFIDCGGYDGCSAVKFISTNPDFRAITFEPNPAMWTYYNSLPTTLIRKGVSFKEQKLPMWIDHVDGDGSSIVPSKRVLHGKMDVQVCPHSIDIECIGIDTIVKALLPKFTKVILKLDVEGAEYDILERLYEERLLRSFSWIYAEFHWKKCGFSKRRHNKLASILREQANVLPWDGTDFAVHQRPVEQLRKRESLVGQFDLRSYQSSELSSIFSA